MTSIVFESARARGTEQKIGQINPLRRYGHAHEVRLVAAEMAGMMAFLCADSERCDEQIASVAAFLASADASYVNGQAIAVDGGLSSSLPVAPGKFF